MVLPPGTPITSSTRALPADELASRPIVTTPRGTSTRQLLDEAFAAARVTPQIAVVTAAARSRAPARARRCRRLVAADRSRRTRHRSVRWWCRCARGSPAASSPCTAQRAVSRGRGLPHDRSTATQPASVTGRPASRHAWKPPMRSVALRKPRSCRLAPPRDSTSSPRNTRGSPRRRGRLPGGHGALDAGSSRHSNTLRSTSSAPGIAPSRCRCSTGRVSTSSAPYSTASAAPLGVTRSSRARVPLRAGRRPSPSSVPLLWARIGDLGAQPAKRRVGFALVEVHGRQRRRVHVDARRDLAESGSPRSGRGPGPNASAAPSRESLFAEPAFGAEPRRRLEQLALDDESAPADPPWSWRSTP